MSQQDFWHNTKHRIRRRLMSGMLLVVPVVVTLAVMQWLFHAMAGVLSPIVRGGLAMFMDRELLEWITREYGQYITWGVSLVSVAGLLALLYVVGMVGNFVMGRRLIAAGETILLKIPLVRGIYGSTKQVLQAVSLQEQAAFQSVVLIEFPRPNYKSLGFLTGHLKDAKGKVWCKLFIPTSPNPTTGFFQIVPQEEVVVTDIGVEEGFKMIVSGGILAPTAMDLDTGKRLPAPAPSGQPGGDGQERPGKPSHLPQTPTLRV